MPELGDRLKVIDHPLVAHKLSLLRRKETPPSVFRAVVEAVSMLLAYEVTRDLPLGTKRIETPLAALDAPYLAGAKVAFVPILRAGNAMLEGISRGGHSAANSAVRSLHQRGRPGEPDVAKLVGRQLAACEAVDLVGGVNE